MKRAYFGRGFCLCLLAGFLLAAGMSPASASTSTSAPDANEPMRELKLDAEEISDRRTSEALSENRVKYGEEVDAVVQSMKIAGLDVSEENLQPVELEDGVVALVGESLDLDSIAVGYEGSSLYGLGEEIPIYLEFESDVSEAEEQQLDAAAVPDGAADNFDHWTASDWISWLRTARNIPVSSPRGPGSTHNGSWRDIWFGNVTIIWTGRGEATAKSVKSRLDNDGWSNKDWFGYRREVWVQPYDISWDFDWSVTGILAGAYPTTRTKDIMLDWDDMSPDNDVQKGGCITREYAVDSPKGGLGVSLTDCDKHDVSFSSTNVGWYEIFYKQGFIFDQGNRSTGFTTAVRVKEGTTPYWNDKTRIEFAQKTYPAKKCEVWNSAGKRIHCP